MYRNGDLEVCHPKSKDEFLSKEIPEKLCYEIDGFFINPLVPDAHYSERQDNPFSLQIQ